MTTPNKQSIIKLRAAPLPADVVALLENNSELLKIIDRRYYATFGLDEFSYLSLTEEGRS